MQAGQAVTIVFTSRPHQSCSCCRQPGFKKPTCSCIKPWGSKGRVHQCLKQVESMVEAMIAKEREKKTTRKWVYLVFAALSEPVQPKEGEASDEGEPKDEWDIVQ